MECPGREPGAVEYLSLAAGEVRDWHVEMAGDCRLRLDPEERFLLGPPGPPAPTGLTLGRAWGYPVVRAVAPGTAGERAGLLPGDLIVAVGSQPLDEEDVGELLGLLTSRPETRLRIRRGNEEVEAVFRPQGSSPS
jgi:S1-C subfamily serine protease